MCTEIGNELTLSVAKRFSLFVHLSQIARQVISSEPKTNDQMCGSTVLLPIEKKKRIKNYWNRLIATHLDTATQWSFYFYRLKDQPQARCLKFLFCWGSPWGQTVLFVFTKIFFSPAGLFWSPMVWNHTLSQMNSLVFFPKRSTMWQLISAVDDWDRVLDSGSAVRDCFVDKAKAIWPCWPRPVNS